MSDLKILGWVAGLALVGLPQAVLAGPPGLAVIAQQPATPSTPANAPACYIITKNGGVTNLSALCGFEQKANDFPSSTDGGNAVNSPRSQVQFAPTQIGQVPVPRLNVRNNRDTQLTDYR